MDSYNVLEDIVNFKPKDLETIYRRVKFGDDYLASPKLNTLQKSTYVCIFKVEPKIDVRKLYDLIVIGDLIRGKRYKTKAEHIWEGDVKDTIYNNLYFEVGGYPVKVFTNGTVIHICNTRNNEEYYIATKIGQYISDLTGCSYTLELDEEKSTAGYSYKITNLQNQTIRLDLDKLAMACFQNPNIRPNYNNVEDGTQISIQLMLEDIPKRKSLPFITLTRNGSVTIKSPSKYVETLNNEFWNIIKSIG